MTREMRTTLAVFVLSVAAAAAEELTPAELRELNPCYDIIQGPTATGQIREFQRSFGGFAVAIAMTLALTGVAVFVTYRNYQRNHWQHITFEKLPNYKRLTFRRSLGDYFRMLTLFTDIMQVGGIILTANYAFNYWGQGDGEITGTNFHVEHTQFRKNQNHGLKVVLSAFLLNFDEASWWMNGVGDYNNIYWDMVALCNIFALTFVAVCCVIWFQLDAKCVAVGCLQKITLSLPYLGILLGNIMFIPIMLNLLTPFSCLLEVRTTVDPTGTLGTVPTEWEQWPSRDCTQTCWNDKSANYAAVSALVLAAYVPWAVYTVPAWQMMHDTVTLKDQPFFTIVTIFWKLWLCLAHAFFEQFPIIHSSMMFVLTGGILVVTIFKRPTTLPFFDLVLITGNAIVFWSCVCIISGLFILEWVVVAMIWVGMAFLILEFWVLNYGSMGDDQAGWAKGSRQWKERRKAMRDEQTERKVAVRRRLIALAQHKNAMFLADNPRDVPKLNMRGVHNQSQKKIDLSRGEWVFRNKETGKEVRVVGLRNKNVQADESVNKVVGLHLKTTVPTQAAMSFQIRDGQQGTLLIMRSPHTTLYQFLHMKINGFVAYHNAHAGDDSIQQTLRPLPGPLRESADGYMPFLTMISGPGHDIAPIERKDDDEKVAEFTPVNANNLVSVLQNVGGPDKNAKYFEASRGKHGKELTAWILRNNATHTVLGKEVCRLFGIPAYVRKKEVRVPGKKTKKVVEEIEQQQKLLQNLERAQKQRLREATLGEFRRGKVVGLKEKEQHQ